MQIPFVQSQLKNFETFRRQNDDQNDLTRENLLTTIEELERQLRRVEERSEKLAKANEKLNSLLLKNNQKTTQHQNAFLQAISSELSNNRVNNDRKIITRQISDRQYSKELAHKDKSRRYNTLHNMDENSSFLSNNPSPFLSKN